MTARSTAAPDRLVRLLLVEDEPKLADLLRARLRAAGFPTDHVTTLGDAAACVEMTAFDLVLLDRRLPDGDGVALIPTLRRWRPGVPIIVLTALDAVPDRVSGLDAGADDYLAKPFEMDELLARIRAALRRGGALAEAPATCGRVAFDTTQRQASVAGEAVPMGRRELALLELLVLRAGKVTLRETIERTLYGIDDEVQSNALDVHVSRLRRRLAALDAQVTIHTVRGVGFMMKAD